MNTTIRKRLFELAEDEYRQFHSALLPGIDNIIGVRLPNLRQLAKEIAKGDWKSYLAVAEDRYYEEIMLQGLVISYVTGDIEEILPYIAVFVPKINNWAVCDSCSNSLKITKKSMPQVWAFLQPYLHSQKEYELRFGIVMLLSFYITDEYIDRLLIHCDNAKHDGYYVKMAVAWAISIAFIKYPEKTMTYLTKNTLDDFTYNKALQKITESFRVDKATKIIIRSMKRGCLKIK